ncbi:MAG: hypothetical protein Q8L88_14490 [Bacteroidota bacterium]|nr:hypothetical protein [Bacteroidota bacterium]
MQSNEEYLLRVLHRTSGGLVDSLIPAHGAKLTKLLEKFSKSKSPEDEVNSLFHVQGFSKCALAMEWLLKKTKVSNNSFSPEQFESDILLLNEKLFEAFLNQPFDMPDFSRTFEAPVRPIQDIHISDDEFIGSTYSLNQPLQDTTLMDGKSDNNQKISEPVWDTASPMLESFESALTAAPTESVQKDSSPALSDAMNGDLWELTQRVAQSAIEFPDKLPNERAIGMSVLRVTARSANDLARDTNNVVVQEFYDALVRLISFADEKGKIRSDGFAETIHDIGDRLLNAMRQTSGGITVLQNITKFINDPKELLSSK